MQHAHRLDGDVSRHVARYRPVVVKALETVLGKAWISSCRRGWVRSGRERMDDYRGSQMGHRGPRAIRGMERSRHSRRVPADDMVAGAALSLSQRSGDARPDHVRVGGQGCFRRVPVFRDNALPTVQASFEGGRL